jgi:hypothetical protein
MKEQAKQQALQPIEVAETHLQMLGYLTAAPSLGSPLDSLDEAGDAKAAESKPSAGTARHCQNLPDGGH